MKGNAISEFIHKSASISHNILSQDRKRTYSLFGKSVPAVNVETLGAGPNVSGTDQAASHEHRDIRQQEPPIPTFLTMLPAKVLARILGKLSIKDLTSCLLTCLSWYHVTAEIRRDRIVAYGIEHLRYRQLALKFAPTIECRSFEKLLPVVKLFELCDHETLLILSENGALALLAPRAQSEDVYTVKKSSVVNLGLDSVVSAVTPLSDRWIIVGVSTGDLLVYGASTLTLHCTLKSEHKDGISAIQQVKRRGTNEIMFVTGGFDGSCRLYKLIPHETAASQTMLRSARTSMSAFYVGAPGHYTIQLVQIWKDFEGGVFCLDTFGSYVMAGCADGKLRLCEIDRDDADAPGTTSVVAFKCHEEPVTSVKFCKSITDQLIVVSACFNSAVCVWRLKKETISLLCQVETGQKVLAVEVLGAPTTLNNLAFACRFMDGTVTVHRYPFAPGSDFALNDVSSMGGHSRESSGKKTAEAPNLKNSLASISGQERTPPDLVWSGKSLSLIMTVQPMQRVIGQATSYGSGSSLAAQQDLAKLGASDLQEKSHQLTNLARTRFY